MGLQIFHVLEHSGNGGETMIADGFKASVLKRDGFTILIFSEVKI